MFIRSVVTGCWLRDLSVPRTAEAGSFGNKTTLPSGCTKNLTRSPGCSTESQFRRLWQRNAALVAGSSICVASSGNADQLLPSLMGVQIDVSSPPKHTRDAEQTFYAEVANNAPQ
jgi:hypothetical protein